MLNPSNAALMTAQALARFYETKDGKTFANELKAIHDGMTRIPDFLKAQPKDTRHA